MTKIVEDKWIAGFWRRIGAFFIDAVLLGVIGFILGTLFKESFVQMGSAGRLIGFLIALTYFGIMNSKLFNGQTVGKRLINVKVVNAENEAISVGISFFRYCILGLPFFLNGVYFNEESLPEIVTYLLTLVVFGGILSTSYLYLFNRVTRQSLHDLCVRTFVVNANSERDTIGNVWKPHYFMVVCVLVASIISPVLMLSYIESSNLISEQSHKELMHMRERLLLLPEVNQAAVMVRQSAISSTSSETRLNKYLQIQTFINNPNVDNKELALAMATAAHENFSELEELQAINVILTYGFDIGIASLVENHSHQFNPTEIGQLK
jgi:uncharacterized RDD family membrane protein YckC